MKKHTKIIIISFFIFSLLIFINSRRVVKNTFEHLVLINKIEIVENCITRRKIGLIEKELSFRDSLYNYYIDSHGFKKICFCEEKLLDSIVKIRVQESLEENCKFVW
jgi:hypothetical protein